MITTRFDGQEITWELIGVEGIEAIMQVILDRRPGGKNDQIWAQCEDADREYFKLTGESWPQ